MKTKNTLMEFAFNFKNKFEIAYSILKKQKLRKIKETCLYLRSYFHYLDRTVRLLRPLDHLIFPATKND